MKKPVIIILSLTAFILGFLIFYHNRPAEQNTSTIITANQQTGTKQNWESKTDNQLAVTVSVAPIDILSEVKEWKFDIVMDTHSVELDHDLMKSAILIDDQGKEYKPIHWEGSAGGHHREGVLIFNKITPAPKSVELKIKNVGGVSERLFTWGTKQ